ncbi:Chaperone protein dnaJ [Recurvomyces mirabilis]|uniref:Chaperone protein dnaJ n=1 Tax=Recurvomyces mirabilis TaxID=574656 RepID=A0AAE0WHB9_9PEZI|nr:Chaperone protein dnaJ [Recurvomyces mirabilis]KAK5152121.1 Chaperone protein dnaJ [Recurvomyces mirabilis]
MSAKANGKSDHNDGSSARAFTPDQKAAVIRVRKCGPTAYYDILGLESVRKECSDSEIKKAYRKLSLLTHPDKNGYTGADEAFKMVSRAFQVLSDSDKKSKFDRFGGDPESRFGGGGQASGASPFSGFASQRAGGGGRGGPMFEEEISPEELFRQFFGGGMGGGFGGGGPFGGGGGGMFGAPGFAFNVGGGGPGVRIHQFGGNQPRRRPHNHENAQPQSLGSALTSLLPIILLFLIPLLSSLFSGSTPSGPSMRFDAAVPPHTLSHTSNRLSVPYWVNPSEVSDFTARKWKDLDKVAENKYVNQLSAECEWEQAQRQRLAQEAQGFFFTDQTKLERARRMEMPSCRKLEGYGYRVGY